MSTFFLTVGQMYRVTPHPNGFHPDSYVIIHAKGEAEARELAFKNFGTKWAFLYNEDRFNPSLFPRGPSKTIGDPSNDH